MCPDKADIHHPVPEAIEAGIVTDEDTEPENIRAIHEEHARELFAALHSLKVVLDARRRGVDPTPAKKKSVAGLTQYISERRGMLDYAKAIEEGKDIGSGPTEASCKTLTLRLKRPGMKWDGDNAAAMMNLIAMRESGQWQIYWQQEARKAA
jgi:hypothetical protein